MTYSRLAVFCVALIALPLAAATRIWSGTNSGSWSDAGNWGGTLPSPGDDLVFPNGTVNQNTTNDFAAGTSFHSITITGGMYTLDGNLITLGAGGLFVPFNAHTINLPITLGASQTWSTTGNGAFIMYGNVNLNGSALILSIGGSITSAIGGVISGAGTIVKNGVESIEIIGINTYSGITTINQGYLLIGNTATPLGVEDGTAANGTVINSGGTLSVLNAALGNEAISATGPGQSGDGALQNTVCQNATFTGPITLSGTVTINACGPGGSMTFNGVISGTNVTLNLIGGSPVFFNAVNTLSGKMIASSAVPAAVVNIGVTNAFSDVEIEVDLDEMLKLNNFNDLLRSVSGAGPIDLGSATLTTAGNQSAPYNGTMSGTGNLTVNDFLTLTGPNTATGTLTRARRKRSWASFNR